MRAFQFATAQATLYHEEMVRQFELIAEYPQLGRALEPHRPDLCRFGYGRHVIIYAVTAEMIEIRRVLHDRMDLPRHIGRR